MPRPFIAILLVNHLSTFALVGRLPRWRSTPKFASPDSVPIRLALEPEPADDKEAFASLCHHIGDQKLIRCREGISTNL
jgi:hypothetical protein